MPIPAISQERVQAVIAGLPTLPSAVRYYDDFMDVWHSIRHPAELDEWPVITDGKTHVIDFAIFGAQMPLIKHLILWQLGCLDPTTVLLRYEACRNLLKDSRGYLINAMVVLKPYEFRDLWIKEVASIPALGSASLKSFLFAICDLNIGEWTPDYRDYVTKLPLPKTDKYRVVRTGDCFVPLDQQSLLIDYFDELSHQAVANPDKLRTEELREVCVLIIVFQHAFRPGQIARIKEPDVRVFNTGAVHFGTTLAKKRAQNQRRRVNRRVKREWCPLFIEYSRRRSLGMDFGDGGVPKDSYFGLTPDSVGICIRRAMQRLTDEDWTATDLRHTAAQRQVDGGTSHISLSEFMGHSDLRTANVYMDTSPSQAQRINEALGISIYADVMRVARTKTIDKAALLSLPPDKQIGGVPHGIPIAGIGGCATGQSLCAKNPILSCYTCRKFMPVKDPDIHRHVAEELRPVVLEFANASRDNTESPAYTQLRRMLTAVEIVAAGIEEPGANE